jgi:hypothetical protein
MRLFQVPCQAILPNPFGLGVVTPLIKTNGELGVEGALIRGYFGDG